jgi:hypothetical protein
MLIKEECSRMAYLRFFIAAFLFIFLERSMSFGKVGEARIGEDGRVISLMVDFMKTNGVLFLIAWP